MISNILGLLYYLLLANNKENIGFQKHVNILILLVKFYQRIKSEDYDQKMVKQCLFRYRKMLPKIRKSTAV